MKHEHWVNNVMYVKKRKNRKYVMILQTWYSHRLFPPKFGDWKHLRPCQGPPGSLCHLGGCSHRHQHSTDNHKWELAWTTCVFSPEGTKGKGKRLVGILWWKNNLRSSSGGGKEEPLRHLILGVISNSSWQSISKGWRIKVVRFYTSPCLDNLQTDLIYFLLILQLPFVVGGAECSPL